MRTAALALLFAAAGHSLAMDPTKPTLIRNPSIGTDTIVFEFGTDLWTVPREGGRAKRLTVGPGVESLPRVSPDGKWVAFTGEYAGNPDAYVMPISGGQPKRLTYHPGDDQVRGWTPDGKSVLFTSTMDQPNNQGRLYTIPVQGEGWPTALPLPRGMAGSFSADGSHIAYVPHELWQPEWKRYKGGQTPPIWIADLSDSRIVKIPRQNSNDNFPMWMGDTIYFVSDRAGRSTLFAYDTNSKKVSEMIAPSDLDIKSASAGTDVIVYEKIGGIYLFDPKSRASHPVKVELDDDFVELRPSYRQVGNQIADATISPTGARVAFEARGDIFTVPIENGDARNLTQSSGSAERSPAWSPDGNKIAYLSDKSGNYRLIIVDQKDGGNPTEIELSDKVSWYHSLSWSPDSKSLTYVDQDMNLYVLDVAARKPKKIDQEPYYFFGDTLNPSWSPDSKWIVYTKRLPNKIASVFVYSLATGKTAQLTDGLSDCTSAVFDRSGKYLYFLASTDVAESISVGGMSSMNRPTTYTPYLMVLAEDEPSPFAPESDEEEGETPPPTTPPTPPTPPTDAPPPSNGPRPIQIDFEGISQRILNMPLPAGLYTRIVATGPNSALFLRAATPLGGSVSAIRYSLESRQAMPWMPSIGTVITTAKGDLALIQGPGGWQVVSTAQPVQPGQGAVNVGSMQSLVDPAKEWRQMFYEVWRNMRDFLYDPNTHGLDISKVEARYEPYLENLVSRQDYNYLMQDMLNEVTVGHTFSGGGDLPEVEYVPGGLLGADYKRNQGRYQFSKIYNGENWNPNLRAPLTQPGAVVKPGEFLIKVNGRDITDKDNIYEAFENTAGKQVSITVASNPAGSEARTLTVVPVANEANLRYKAWVEGNRRKVDEISGGKVSYIYVPDTGGAGFASFNRYFTAQLDKPAVLVDDRFNSGGALSDYIVQILSRKVLAMANQRDHTDFPIPIFSNEGPKAMLINEMAGSGGDALPWFFRVGEVGPLFGTRTWGGLVAAGQGVPLMAGGFATAPQVAIYGLKGEWEVENHGVAPDFEIDEDPYLWRQGKDPQMEAAVKYLLEQLAKHPRQPFKRPPYPNYHKGGPLGRS